MTNNRFKKIPLYLWISLAYTVLWWLSKLSNYENEAIAYLVDNLWRMCFVVVVNFIFFEYTAPFVLRKRQYIISNILLAIPLLAIHVLLWAYGLYAWRGLGILLHIYTPLGDYGSVRIVLQSQMAFSMGSVFFFAIVRHIYSYVQLQESTKQLQIEKQKAELNYLKSQTNPHFLFNTLNNIYSLSRDKSDLAPESILRLSKILRFMLYETGGNYINLEQEITIINDYIELEKLRYDETLRVDFKYDIEDKKQALPPLLLMPLVENAFKHGVSETRDSPFIAIILTAHDHQLFFSVKNSMEAGGEAIPIKENIGLSNLRRQLELLYKDYNLKVNRENEMFTATLKINMVSHV